MIIVIVIGGVDTVENPENPLLEPTPETLAWGEAMQEDRSYHRVSHGIPGVCTCSMFVPRIPVTYPQLKRARKGCYIGEFPRNAKKARWHHLAYGGIDFWLQGVVSDPHLRACFGCFQDCFGNRDPRC